MFMDIDFIFGAIAEEMGVSREQILSGNRSIEVVDARHVAIALIGQMCKYPTKIARIMCVTPRTVNYALTNFDDRLHMSRPLRIAYARICGKLSANYEELRNDLGKT